MDLHLAGRVAVVTGGPSGVSLAVTRTLLQEGARVVLASRATTERTAPKPTASIDNLLHVAVDLADSDAPAQVITS